MKTRLLVLAVFLGLIGTEIAMGKEKEMEPIYDQQGKTVGWLNDGVIYDRANKYRAFVEDGNIFTSKAITLA